MSIKVYYLKYPSQATGISDLISKGIIVDSGLTFTGNVQSVVNINDPATSAMTIFNVMTTDLIDFGAATYFPTTFEHQYGGWQNVMVPVYIMPFGIYEYYTI